MTTKIQDLADQVAYNTSVYSQYLSTNNLPAPSHHLPPLGKPIVLPLEVEDSRQLALEAAHELHDLLSGSVGHVMNAAARVRQHVPIPHGDSI